MEEELPEMKKSVSLAVLLFAAAAAAAYAVRWPLFDTPIIRIDSDFWRAKNARIAVALVETPPVGAYVRESAGMAEMWRIQSSDPKMDKQELQLLNAEARVLARAHFDALRAKFVKRLQDLGFTNVTEVPDMVPPTADSAALKGKVPFDVLVLISVDAWGLLRDFHESSQTSDTYSFVSLTARIIRGGDNRTIGTYHLPYLLSSLNQIPLIRADHGVKISQLQNVIDWEGSTMIAHFGENAR